MVAASLQRPALVVVQFTLPDQNKTGKLGACALLSHCQNDRKFSTPYMFISVLMVHPFAIRVFLLHAHTLTEPPYRLISYSTHRCLYIDVLTTLIFAYNFPRTPLEERVSVGAKKDVARCTQDITSADMQVAVARSLVGNAATLNH